MAEITPGLVKQLRELTGAGMMDCKKALAETGGDLEAAVDALRKKGLAAAAKKSGRVAAEGLIGLQLGPRSGALVEVNSETDFVARNETFQGLVREISGLAPRAGGDAERLRQMALPSGRTVDEAVQQAVAVIGENITVRRTAQLEVPEGVVAGYLHNQVAPGLGKIGVLVALRSGGDSNGLAELGKQLAMHVAAARPQALDVSGIDPTQVDRERQIYADQARATGKPENIIEKMVEGRLRKFYEEAVLLEQAFVIDTDKRVKQVLAESAKTVGGPVEIAGFVRFELGEGVDKGGGDDFAAEVAKLSQS